MAKCPFSALEKDCPQTREGPYGCRLWKEVARVMDSGEVVIVKDCVFNLDHDERRNQTQRIAMMQSEAGETRQTTLFQALTLCGVPEARRELMKLALRSLKDENVGEISGPGDQGKGLEG